MEQPIPIRSGAADLAGMLYLPEAGGVRGALLFCDPLFEERKSAQRALVELARALAAAGVAVLRFDYRGCGDSPGDFAEFAPDDWLADALAAYAELRRRVPPGVPAGFFGLRLGAALAAQAAGRVPAPWLLMLWEPVLRGGEYLQQELRRKLMKEMLTFGGSRTTREGLVRQLEAGETVDFDGFAVTPRLYRELGALRLRETVAQLRLPLLLASVSASGTPPPPLATLAEALRTAGLDATLLAEREQPFWSLVGHVDCAGLIRRSVAWVTPRLLPPQPPVPPPARPPAPVAAAPEERVSFEVEGETVHAILHAPSRAAAGQGAARPGILFCAGWTGSRIGPHRMFVKMARRLAADGFWCLRHDYRGRGDSAGRAGTATIRGMTADTLAAARVLADRAGVRDLILLGICSGGKVAIGTAVAEPRVRGLVLWSGEALGPLRSVETNRRKRAFALRAYLAKLMHPATWRKILTGRVNVRAVNQAVFRPESPSEVEARQEAEILRRFRAWRGTVLLVYGANDPDTALAGARYRAFCAAQALPHHYHEIAEANHSFYSLAWEQQVLDQTADWLRQASAPTASP